MEGLDDEELEDEADEEVEKILYDLTDGKLGQAGTVGAELPVSNSAIGAIHPNAVLIEYHDAQARKEAEEDINTEAEMQRMQKELHDLLAG